MYSNIVKHADNIQPIQFIFNSILHELIFLRAVFGDFNMMTQIHICKRDSNCTKDNVELYYYGIDFGMTYHTYPLYCTGRDYVSF